jgi:hypothetical protein
MKIRAYTEADWEAIWPIFREVVAAGETYVYEPEWSSRRRAGSGCEPQRGTRSSRSMASG